MSHYLDTNLKAYLEYSITCEQSLGYFAESMVLEKRNYFLRNDFDYLKIQMKVCYSQMTFTYDKQDIQKILINDANLNKRLAVTQFVCNL